MHRQTLDGEDRNLKTCGLVNASHIRVQLKKIFLDFIFYLFLKRGEGREKERERHIDVKEKHWIRTKMAA